MGYFTPGEALPCGEADRDSGVKVATGGGGTGDDGEGDTNGETPADLEDAAKGGDAERGGAVNREGCYGCDTGEAGSLSVKVLCWMKVLGRDLHVKEYACCFSHALPQPARPVASSEEAANWGA